MKIIQWLLTFLIGFASLWGVLFLALTAYGWENVWTKVSGPADSGPVIFEDFAKTAKPHQALICPDGICNDQDRDRTSPIYKLNVDALKSAFLESLEKEKSLTRVDDGKEDNRMRYVQRTRLLRFPDTINVQFFALGEKRSTLALYGRSQIGTSDLGVNLQRLNRWLDRLSQFEETSNGTN